MGNVLCDLVKQGVNLSKYVIIYRDSMGMWDRIKVEEGKLVAFESLNKRTYEEARAALIKRGLL